VNACSARCSWCGRCTSAPGAHVHLPSRADFIAIRAGLVRVGLDRDYFNWEDIEHLWKRGQRVEQIVAAALEHQDRYRRLSRTGS
jgi:hypothetical protein